MQSETRQCQNCKQPFVIEPDDFAFYEKIKVPPPTWCPDCRMVRRMMFRNERAWYRRKCDATGKEVLSMIAPGKPYKVYSQEYWKSDAWDPLSFGSAYDFSLTFFEQFDALLRRVPQPNLIQKNLVNSEYANYSLNTKDCYYIVSVDGAEGCSYLFGSVLNAKNSYDCHQSTDVEFCYELIDCLRSYRLFYGQNCVECTDSTLLYDCRNCQNCFGCVGLRNQQYCFFNEKCSKEEYEKKIEGIRGNRASFLGALQKFNELKLKVPRKYAAITKSSNVIGNDITNSKDCYHCFYARDGVERVRYSFKTTLNASDGSDAYIAWNGSELFYEVLSIAGQNVKYSALIWGGFNIEYSYNCFDCNNIFGCTGLRDKKYCILNKQYTKEEYEELVPKIVAHMNAMPYLDPHGRVYRYGEFFPPVISPFSLDETVVQEYFPEKMGKLKELGYVSGSERKREYKITKHATELPDRIEDVPDSFVDEVIACEHLGVCHDMCSSAFKVTKSELEFYKKFFLPLPHLCPGCRHLERLRLKTPLHLWHRTCMCDRKNHAHQSHCPNEFETSYAPESPEIVYCEACYNAEVA